MKASVFLTSLFFALSALPAIANPVPGFPFVIVTETLEKKVRPDVAKVRFNIKAYENSSHEAVEMLTKYSAMMLEALIEHGIEVSELESTQVNKSEKRKWKDGAYSVEILGYEVEQAFNLRITDLSKYPGLMNDLVRLDGVKDIDAFFETSKEGEYKEKMITELSAKARNKADALAQAQSRKVKRVYGITTEGNFGQAYAIFSLEYNPAAFAIALSGDSYGMDLVMAVPEFIKVGQRITAIYELK